MNQSYLFQSQGNTGQVENRASHDSSLTGGEARFFIAILTSAEKFRKGVS
jgi:hypothetical protein